MAQARRRKPAKSSPKKRAGRGTKAAFSVFKQGFSFFVTGVLAGVLGVLFWQGYQSDSEGDMGSGLREMVEQSRQQAKLQASKAVAPKPVLVDKAPRAKTPYEFYTVLPEFEEVLPKDAPAEVTSIAVAKSENKSKVKAKPVVDNALKPGGSYVLQVASYGQRADAEKLKAKLALGGLRSHVQEVSIESKKYYRVRVGPYSDYGSMTSDDYKLSRMGFKALRLKISKAG